MIPFQSARAEIRYFLVLFEESLPSALDLEIHNFDRLEPSDLEREIVQEAEAGTCSSQTR